MNLKVSIACIAHSEAESSWLKLVDTSYSGVFDIRYQAPHQTRTDLNETDLPDLVIVDSSVGYEEARSYMADLLLSEPHTPILISLQEAQLQEWNHLVRHGAQDFILKELDSPGQIHRGILNAIDRSAILKATQESEARFRTVIESISDGVLIVDEQGFVLYANPAAEDLLGVTLLDIYGLKTPLSVSYKHPETVILKNDGSEQTVLLVSPSTIFWESRPCVLLNMRDITKEHRAKELLEKAREDAQHTADLKSAFLANMSHELRLPLASIIGYAQIIEEGTKDPDYKEFSAVIQESSHRLLDTINAVLEATRLDQHMIHPVLTSVSVPDAVGEVIRALGSLVSDSNLIIDSEGHQAWVRADEGFLNRILTNLIGNAIKFTAQGRIRISWSQIENRVDITIADSGIGMDQSFLNDAFSAFSQESTGPGRTHEGSGLGLSITKGLVESLEGSISVESEKNKGSIFTFSLPASTEPPPAAE